MGVLLRGAAWEFEQFGVKSPNPPQPEPSRTASELLEVIIPVQLHQFDVDTASDHGCGALQA